MRPSLHSAAVRKAALENPSIPSATREADRIDLQPPGPPADTPPGLAYEDLGDLPLADQEEMVFLVARDPRWLFAYWDFDYGKYPASSMRYGYAQFFLKIVRPSGQQESLVEINPNARNWYVPVHLPDTDYLAEIGYFDREGAWRKIVGSPVAHTPPDALASESPTDVAAAPGGIGGTETLLGAQSISPNMPSSAVASSFTAEQDENSRTLASLRMGKLEDSRLREQAAALSVLEQFLTGGLTSRSDRQICLHESYTGTVSEIVGSQVVVVYEVEDGQPLKQIYSRSQFNTDYFPLVGDELQAFVFLARLPSVPADAAQEAEPDFSGFEKGTVGNVEF